MPGKKQALEQIDHLPPIPAIIVRRKYLTTINSQCPVNSLKLVIIDLMINPPVFWWSMSIGACGLGEPILHQTLRNSGR